MRYFEVGATSVPLMTRLASRSRRIRALVEVAALIQLNAIVLMSCLALAASWSCSSSSSSLSVIPCMLVTPGLQESHASRWAHDDHGSQKETDSAPVAAPAAV